MLSHPSISCDNTSIWVSFEHWESFFLQHHDNAKGETLGSFITWNWSNLVSEDTSQFRKILTVINSAAL